MTGNLPATRISIALLAGASFVATGCRMDDPCDPGQELRNGFCFDVEEEGGSAGQGGAAGGAGSAGSGGESFFGKACKDNVNSSDCGGDAPVCADVVFYCTQIECADGETNEGACPADWTCLKTPGNPSACVDL